MQNAVDADSFANMKAIYKWEYLRVFAIKWK